MELEESTIDFRPEIDRRAKVPEPLPVRLVAVNDVRLPASAGIERELDRFYAGLLGFERHGDEGVDSHRIIYHAENLDLVFHVVEGLARREDFRPVGIEVISLAEAELKLIQAELEYTRQRGLVPGQESLLVLDPAGNWVEIVEMRLI
jgi:hypothetical protein